MNENTVEVELKPEQELEPQLESQPQEEPILETPLETQEVIIADEVKEQEQEEEIEERSFLPKLIREIKDVNEDTVEICPSLLVFNRKLRFKCKKVKRSKR
jgi:hypothetical protein